MERIEGRTALVTGAASGMGLSIAEALVEAGARVVLADRDGVALEALAPRLSEAALVQLLDVTDRSGWNRTKQLVESTFGPIEILINNAGIGTERKELCDLDPQDFDRQIAVMLTGVYNGIHELGPGMRDRGEGHILNTSSMTGLVAAPTMAAYSAAKYGVVGLSEALRAEMAPHGVGVSVLCPGLVRTNLDEMSKGSQRRGDRRFWRLGRDRSGALGRAGPGRHPPQ
jgi:NAD(P)-dependent dehydrogenase (short-subunit alcohol dehydrogenase family)